MYVQRDSTDFDNTGYMYNPWRWQKWSLFAIFIVLLVLIVVATLRANYNRIRHGRLPIRGTGWFTPPSYQQSEREYNHDDGIHVNRHNNRRQREENIPKYTEEVGEHDLGFYDPDGKFHPNVQGQMINPPPLETGVVTNENPNTEEHNNNNASEGESVFGIESPDHTASRQRIRQYYNTNFNNVEMTQGSSSNVNNAHELQSMEATNTGTNTTTSNNLNNTTNSTVNNLNNTTNSTGNNAQNH